MFILKPTTSKVGELKQYWYVTLINILDYSVDKFDSATGSTLECRASPRNYDCVMIESGTPEEKARRLIIMTRIRQ